MYVVVKNLKNEFYVVAKRWVVDYEGKTYSFYPPEQLLAKSLANESEPKTNKGWTNEIIMVVSKEMEYADAVKEMKKKLKHADTESEEENNKKKKHSRAHPLDKYSTNRNFNKMYDDNESSVHKLERNLKLMDKSPSNDSDEDKLQENFEHTLSQQKSDENDFLQNSFENESKVLTVSNYNEPMIQIPLSKWNEIFTVLNQINEKIDRYAENTNENFESIINEMKLIKVSNISNISNNHVVVDKPSKISTKDELDQLEKEIDNADKRDVYLQTVKKFALLIQKPSKSYSTENGLVKSFMEMRFDTEFIKTVGWTSVKGRIAFEGYKNHHKLIFDVCNINTPHLFGNIDAVQKSISNYFKRLHETKKSKN
ncbi:hypothetical protein PVAND_007868 [Polypedilum vanderplanki]|uniref:DUF4806 domain-containing protein n=1 Tax=Polypedilum vanderplanki TaxID=319348 RepID=A0A9J6C877_POLVA|nr:hypothetical protein PVAND_007868 [Polypedilum vanderplanki]